MAMPVLCDTVCVWALYFRDSSYRSHVLELRRRLGLIVPDVCLIEAAYPIYRAKGAVELVRYAEFVERLPLAPGVEVLECGYEDLIAALKLASGHSSVFMDRRGNLCLFDAIISSIWVRTGLPLATSDEKLISLTRFIPQLKVIKLEKRPAGSGVHGARHREA